MTNEVEQALARLRLKEEELTAQIKQMMGPVELQGPVLAVDIYSMAIANRTLALLNGFEVLLRSNNYHAAVHLVRLHLDSLLRYAALWHVDNPEDFVREVMNDTQVNHLRDRTGTQMRDTYLKQLVAQDFPWVSTVYERTSGFIHFSRRHILFSTVADAQTLTAQHSVSREDRFVRDESRLEATEAMSAITECIIAYIGWWTATKTGERPEE
jgi:hypothetical protein